MRQKEALDELSKELDRVCVLWQDEINENPEMFAAMLINMVDTLCSQFGLAKGVEVDDVEEGKYAVFFAPEPEPGEDLIFTKENAAASFLGYPRDPETGAILPGEEPEIVDVDEILYS